MNAGNEVKNSFLPAALRLQASFPWFQGKERGSGQNAIGNNLFHDMLRHHLIKSYLLIGYCLCEKHSGGGSGIIPKLISLS